MNLLGMHAVGRDIRETTAGEVGESGVVLLGGRGDVRLEICLDGLGLVGLNLLV